MAARSCSLLIVGAGTAGLACAVEAAAAGAEVVVLERGDDIGGTLHLTGGHLSGAATRRQRDRGIPDSPEAHYADLLRISRGTVDPTLARLAVEEAAPTLDWLERIGVAFDPETPRVIHGHEPYRTPRTVWAAGGGGLLILGALRPLWDQACRDGRIRPHFGRRMTELIRENGRVVGAGAEGPGGSEEFRADAVVLTTGGYASNPDFFAAVTPGARLVSTAHPHALGDGIRAAQTVGAAFRGAENYLPSWGGVEVSPGRASWAEAWAVISTSVYRAPRELVVNARGERFIREDEPSSDARERALLRQPGHRLWLVFDDAALAAGDPLLRGWSHDRLREAAHEGRFAWTADALGPLPERAGVDPQGLLRTVDAYREAVRTGQDPLGREDLGFVPETPPFYAVRAEATSLISFGGLAADAGLRVLDASGRPVPGLYAAGEILGAGATSGNAFCSGMLLTPALALGRRIGRRLGAGAR